MLKNDSITACSSEGSGAPKSVSREGDLSAEHLAADYVEAAEDPACRWTPVALKHALADSEEDG